MLKGLSKILLGLVLSTAALSEESASFEYLYSDGNISKVINNASEVVIGQFGPFQKILEVGPMGDQFSLKSGSVFRVLRVYKGELHEGSSINLEISNSYVRYMDTHFSIDEYREALAEKRSDSLESMLKEYQAFKELWENDMISDKNFTTIRHEFEELYKNWYEAAEPTVHISSSLHRGRPAREFLVGDNDVALVFLRQMEYRFGVLDENSFELAPTPDYAIYMGLEKVFIEELLEDYLGEP